MQKSWKSWITYGGGGYAINSAPSHQNYPFGGWVLENYISTSVKLGGELYSQGRSATNIPSYTILNLGGTYRWTRHFATLLSAGHNILGQRNTVAYVGVYWTADG
jgi:hypothetical protein